MADKNKGDIMDSVSPMMRHYLKTKSKYKDCVLFYRLGDFYEMFFDDAIMVSKELDLTLTGKNCGLEERAPMCGIPFHAADSYITKLVNNGHKVAICEQLEDPKTAKGIVKRDVIRIITPGTNMDEKSLDETKNNYLLSVMYMSDTFGIAVSDISTGEFHVTVDESLRAFLNDIQKYEPSEIICNDAFLISGVDIDDLKNRHHISISALDADYFDEKSAEETVKRQFNTFDTTALDLIDLPEAICASGALLRYLKETQKTDLGNLNDIDVYRNSNFMIIDSSSRRNLELTETLRDKEKRGSLLWVLDHTKTSMGARFLRNAIEMPLRDPVEIKKRLDAVEQLINSVADRDELREYLENIYDLQRLMTRISYRTANPRDLLAFRDSINMIPAIKTVLSGFDSELIKDILDSLDSLDDLRDLLAGALSDDPPVSVHEGSIFRDGYSDEIDNLRNMKSGGKTWLIDLENREKEVTGIKNLRIRYNKVFGYYIEVTNSFKDQVPDRYQRKQTLANSERYSTDELKEMENKILGAEDRLNHLENEMYMNLLLKVSSETRRIQKTAGAIAYIDFLQSLAYATEKYHYSRPTVNSKGIINISHGRHPVVERMIPDGEFIDNDTLLDDKDNRVAIITGPNMAGKSTYMRQTALIVLMAQIGSFIPASSAVIGTVDRIFTRVGASDDLTSGQSTFMVEMNEVANILRNATRNSLLILDEIGRGTSTYDGLSIAWAVVEYISDPKIIGAKTLFATHYHELTELEGSIPGVHNYCSAVKEGDTGVVFLRKIIKGGADKSYGIEVARLAGLPAAVIDRANELLATLSDNDLSEKASKIASGSEIPKKKKILDDVDKYQMSLFDTNPDNDIIEEIKNLDITGITPVEALNKLYDLQNQVKNRWKKI